MSQSPLSEILNQIITWLSGAESPLPDWTPEQWQLFKQAAFIHGVAPILHKKLSNAALPEPISQWLQNQYEHNHSRVGRLQSDLQIILAAFAKAEIPLVPLKGAVLTNHYYDDPGLRPTADIDLLIHPSDYERSLQQLFFLGYEIEKSNWKHAILSRPGNRAIVSYEYEHPDNPRRLDLHLTCREMFSGPFVDITAEIWSSATPGRLLGHPARLPTPDMLLHHLLLHTSSNIWNAVLRLINLLDLHHLTQSPNYQLPITNYQSTNQPNQPINQSPITQLPNYPINHSTQSPITNHQSPAVSFTTNYPITQLPPTPSRFLYPALLFTHRYLPHPTLSDLLATCEPAVPSSFKRWLAKQDIIGRSRLSRESKLHYLSRIVALYSGQPKDLLFALHFLTRRLAPKTRNAYESPSE